MTRSIPCALALALALTGAAAASGQEVDAGRKLALEVCANCHVVPGEARSPVLNPPAPSFVEIAGKPGASAASLSAFLAEPHGNQRRTSGMPPFLLPPSVVEAVVAYLLTLNPK